MSETKPSNISRRDLIAGAGKLAIGSAIAASALSVGFDVKDADASKESLKWGWGYKKIDPKEAGDLAYNLWYKGCCCYAVAGALILPLRKKIGGPYKGLPIDAFRFGHGGVIGWGTICGTLLGAGIATSFIAGKTGEMMLNDIIAWYTETKLPEYKPKHPKYKGPMPVNISDSPLCHVSVGKWMKKADKSFKSPARRDRCARLAADVAIYTVKILNQWVDDGYEYYMENEPQVAKYGITAQNDCMECHAKGIPGVPGK